MTNTILQVALPVPINHTFDYRYVASDSKPKPHPDDMIGHRVQVNFTNRDLVGIVIGSKKHSDTPPEKLKTILQMLDERPLVSEAFIRTCRWAAQYYMSPIGEVIFSAIPPLLRKEQYVYEVSYWEHTNEGLGLPLDGLKRYKKQHAIHQFLLSHKRLMVDDIPTIGFSRNALKTLEKKEIIRRRVTRSIDTERRTQPNISDQDALLKEPPKVLNNEQRNAVQRVRFHEFNCSLLHGATGSGKTEVYLQLTARALQTNAQVLVLVPEIGLSPQTVERFRQRFHAPIVELHSHIAESQRAKNWLAIHSGDARIIIGTRLAAFAPAQDLGLIIIDEEHDNSYKQQDGFRYSARDCSIYRAKTASIPIVLGSATPALETLHNAQSKRYQHLVLRERAGNAQAPTLTIIDLRNQALQSGLSPVALHEISAVLARKEQVLIFLNRRGYAPIQLCHNCGWVSECVNCSTTMTVHNHPPRLQCHYCDRKQAYTQACPNCRQKTLSSQGIGTEQLEQCLSELFVNDSVVRIDRDATRSKKELASKLAQIHSGHPCILIGTQMLAKGHHFPKLTRVIIIDADQGFLNPDFRAVEKMGQLLMQVAGRAGREGDRGDVFIQTHRPDHPMLRTLIECGYTRFARDILHERQRAQLPPYWHCALFTAESKRAENALALLNQLHHIYHRYFPPMDSMHLIGPSPCAMEKVQDRFRFQLLVTGADRKTMRARLSTMHTEIEKHSLSKRVRWALDVDPIEV